MTEPAVAPLHSARRKENSWSMRLERPSHRWTHVSTYCSQASDDHRPASRTSSRCPAAARAVAADRRPMWEVMLAVLSPSEAPTALMNLS